MVLVRLPIGDSRNRPADSPIRAMASVGEADPHLREIMLSVVKLVQMRVASRSQQGYGFGSQSRCPYQGNKWGKGKEDMDTGYCEHWYRT